jgi:hypothetical protein
MKKRLFSILISIIFLLSFLTLPTNQKVYAASSMKVGDYVQFGQYLGSPILWRVINIDSDGSPVLFSEKILSIKPFDAAESGTYNKEGINPYSTDKLRQAYGSNRWENSNIREWLNSSDAKVKYSTQPPTKEAVYANAYENEPGFLSNFSEDERNAIKPVTHKSILADIDKEQKDGGTELHPYNENIDYSVQNYNKAYFENVTDKVYFLDIKEFNDFVYERGFDYIKKPTQEAVSNSEYKYNILNTENYWYYWLRLPCTDFSSYARHVGSDHFIYSSSANYHGGVVPTLNLKSGSIKTGNGTVSDPYIPVHSVSADKLYSSTYSLTAAAMNTKTQKSINDARRALLALENTDAAWAIGELSKQIDRLQDPILVKAVNAINQAQSSIRQADINTAKSSIDSDLPAVWKNSYSSAVDAVQQKLMARAADAVNKASQTKSQVDIDNANVILSDIKTASNASISGWVDALKKELYITKQPTLPSTTMKIGDYIQFGQYLGKPIVWRVINVDSDGLPMLFSEKIISLKPYDASESGRDGETGSNPYTTNGYRQAFGSNRWANSTIREWLNSSDANVKYSTQPPTDAAVFENAYANEAGFLSNFSEEERDAIRPVTHKAILTDEDKGYKIGGTEKIHIYNENIGDWVQNYDNAYYENVTDKVYILDIKELHDYVYNRGFEYVKKPTQEAVNASENKYAVLDPSNYWFYWLRVPCTDDANGVRHMGSTGFVFSSNSTWYSTGVVPALNLKTGAFKSGKGTVDDPYVPDNGSLADKLYSDAYSKVEAAKSAKTQKSLNDARTAIAALKGTPKSTAIGELSRQIDELQQPLLAKIEDAIAQAQKSLKQADIDKVKASIDPDLPAELKNPYTSVADSIQEKLKGMAIAAHNKAVQSYSQADREAANAIIADLQTAVDPLVVSWAANVKNQTGIIQEMITFKDKNLEQAVRNAANKPTGSLYKSDVQKITKLAVLGKSISDLSGIENLTSLQQLDLSGDSSQKTYNYISDLSPLRGLTSLTHLMLNNNNVSDLTPIKGLTNLVYMELNNNDISDLKPLSGLTKLDRLFLNFNKVLDISVVNSLTSLTWLCLEGNPISDITPLKGLPGLSRFTNFNFWNTKVRDAEIIELKKAVPNCSFYNQ